MPIFTPSRFLMYARRVVRNDQLILSVLALFIGVAGGGAVIVFREGITLIQTAFYGSGTESLFKHAQELPWWQLLLAPAAGGLVVGGLVHFFMPGRRPQGVADVIEASALKGGRMSLRSGIKAAVVSAASIGAGASVGREGPAVHLGASIAGWTAKRLHLTRSLSRVLLGCGVAAAVSGSFNAPIAGALFANEVVIGHYALSAFAPVVIASVTGTAISRIWFGDFPAFIIPEHTIASFLELPIFAGLGIVCAVVSIVLMKGIVLSETLAKKTRLPIGLRPAVAGLIVGAIATIFPQVLGIGYGATEAALELSFPLMLFIAMVAAKLIATAVSLGFGFGGGIFSPSLVIGAMLGSAYGLIVTQAMPGISSGADAYSIVGMGAVAAAVLGAPISTTLIIFEMTGDYALTLGVMIAVVVATVITQQSLGHSFFTLQLERRGLDLKGGYAATLLRMQSVRQVMSSESELVSPDVSLQELRLMLQKSKSGELFVVRGNGELYGTITLADLSEVAFDHDMDDLIKAGDVARLHPPVVMVDDNLETALGVMRDTGEEHIAVVEDKESRIFLGCIHERNVVTAYNRSLVEVRDEEHN